MGKQEFPSPPLHLGGWGGGRDIPLPGTLGQGLYPSRGPSTPQDPTACVYDGASLIRLFQRSALHRIGGKGAPRLESLSGKNLCRAGPLMGALPLSTVCSQRRMTLKSGWLQALRTERVVRGGCLWMNSIVEGINLVDMGKRWFG